MIDLSLCESVENSGYPLQAIIMEFQVPRLSAIFFAVHSS